MAGLVENESHSHMRLALVGNANVGKSVLFGHLTGHYVTVSNYPGTTIEITRGELKGTETVLIDTPGINTLAATSEEERVTRDILLSEGVDGIIQVADARNLRRALFLTLQLIEAGIPLLLDLNMEDEAEAHGIEIDQERLSRLLDLPVVGTVATEGKGLEELKRRLPLLKSSSFRPRATTAEGRWEEIDRLCATVWKKTGNGEKGWLKRLGELSMHPIWGVGVLAVVLALLYLFVGKFGAQIAVDWLEKGFFGRFVNPAAFAIFSKLFFFSPFLRDLFVGPYGLITMALTYALAIIFPIVLTFFTAFSVIEDSGYLPRLAILLNRFFGWMGLNGKAVVPMVLGLGCDTMATMTARVLDTRKERILLTLLLALGVPCSAQLGIVLGILSALPLWATFLWLGVVGGSLVGVGFLASKVLPGDRSDFVMEIPPLRRPLLFNIFVKTTARLEWYLKEVVPIFLLGTFTLFLLDKLSWLPAIERAANPLVVKGLHLPPAATEAFLIGFLRRDYGATHFFAMFGQGRLDATQAIVALIVMTLFVPCFANLLMIIKERGLKVAAGIVGFIYPFAFLVGGVVDWALRNL